MVYAEGSVQVQLTQWCLPTSRSSKWGCLLRLWPLTLRVPLCQFGGWGGEESVHNSLFGLFRAWPEGKMTLRYMLKVRTVRLLQRTEVWAEPSLISPLVYNRVDTEAGGFRCCLSTCCFAFTWNSSRRNKLLARYGLWHDQSGIRWLKLVCHYWISASSPRFIAPIAILCFHMAFPGELDDGQS